MANSSIFIVLIFIASIPIIWILLLSSEKFRNKALKLYSKLIKKSVEYQNKQKKQLNKSKRKRSK